MEKVYRIADTAIAVDLKPELEQLWLPFLSKELEEEIQFDLYMYPQNYYNIDVLDISGMQYALRDESGMLFSDSDWSHGRLYANTTVEISALVMMQLYSYLISRNTVLVHSSLVDFKGNGIMFLGPSGIGKTTQAELWNKYMGADILNGDLVFVRKNKDGFYGYGSPWHGSSPYYQNAKVKIKALVALEQGKENVIQKLEGFEAFNRVMNQIYLPHWYKHGMDCCYETIDSLLCEVPTYHLSCKPDEDAVMLVKKQLNI